MKKKFTYFLFATFLLSSLNLLSEGVIIPSNKDQNDFIKAYKLAVQYSNIDYRFTNTTMDSVLFPKFGEFSIYWVREGENRGSFVYPDVLPRDYSNVTARRYSNYNWSEVSHYSIQFKPNQNLIGIFRSELVQKNSTVSWASFYYKNLLDLCFYDNIYFFTNEKLIDSIGLSNQCRILIIPPFRKFGESDTYYIDTIFSKYPNLKTKFEDFLSTGGTIYTEGNAVYFLEKLGLIPQKSVDFTQCIYSDAETNIIDLKLENGSNPLYFAGEATNFHLYGTYFPKLNLQNVEIVAREKNFDYPVIFVINTSQAKGGKVIVNTGLPTVGGMNNLNRGSRQIQWTLNTILYAFCSTIDITRSIFNDLPKGISANPNAISYDRIDTFEVRIKIRNLGNSLIKNVSLTENLRPYFKFIGITNSNIEYQINGSNCTISNIQLFPFQEMDIVLLVSTPDPIDKIHEDVNKYISWANYIYVSYLEARNEGPEGKEYFRKYQNFAELMFSARLVADTDLNWKNILYSDFQPFKVFMIMENKERTPAMETKYVQYIPKDVPFYWTDNNINIPILRSPGGKYVDILRGSNDKNNPDYDLDSDGYPDVWLDTSSIYPKGYSIEETEVYWLNPWEHLRSGDTLFYEDINHDGMRAKDIDGDGTVDIEAPGDKIRVWKVTWDIGKVAGYEYFDPYCYFEIWLDPPDLVLMSAGVSETQGKLDENIAGLFYPYSKDIRNPNLNDTSWTHWMERDKNGNVIWKQLIYQRIHNYEGFTFIDTLREQYKLKPTDRCVGTVPQPHREYIAVLSLGGKEIDMNNPTPSSSPYSNLIYKTIFNETRITPIRTTYTYWAPLPNPLQFEYLTNSFLITDSTGTIQYQHLPQWGKALLTFTMDASTEYSYYWIRNAGHDVDYNDPSLAIEGVDKLGDGVFGYLLYSIPKGIGGYKITLPKKSDGTFDIDKIIKINGRPYQTWIENPNTKKDVEIFEDPFQYLIHIPQILIPPALDDDNFDGIDDWIDDRGDRFQSSTGFLHDKFMLDDAEKWLDYPKTPFQDDIYGMVKSGWFPGPDSTYGDDKFEKLGTTRIQIQALYEGLGKEGSIEISKGGWLVVEEIFGGSPWVIFSHTLSGFSSGSNIRITSKVQPSTVRYGIDTTFILHTIEDFGEPHLFDINFDPYHVSYGYGDITITSFAGGRDPCNLISPNIETSTIIDLQRNKTNLTILPFADNSKPEFNGYPKNITGSFLEVRVELNNSTEFNLVNTKIVPILPKELKNTKLIFSYVAYPRPLVPAKFDPKTGKIIYGGDDFATLRTGWRFNQPEGEVLVNLGNTINLIQPTRKAYYVFLFFIDSTLANGVYSIDFALDGEKTSYKGERIGKLNHHVPSILFSISQRKTDLSIAEYQKFVIGKTNLKRIETLGTSAFIGLEQVRWSDKQITYLDYDTLKRTLKANFNLNSRNETIDLSEFVDFPTKDFTKFYLLEKVQSNSSSMPEKFNLTNSEKIYYQTIPYGDYYSTDKPITLTSVGPKVLNFKRITAINNKVVQENQTLEWEPKTNFLEVTFYLINIGTDIAEDVVLEFTDGPYFEPFDNPTLIMTKNGSFITKVGGIVPGEIREIKFLFKQNPDACSNWYDNSLIIKNVEVRYNGPRFKTSTSKEAFSYIDKSQLAAPANDLYITDIKPSEWEVNPNETVNIYFSLGNGLTNLTHSFLFNTYAVINFTDTILIGSDTISQLKPLENTTISKQFIIPEGTFFIDIYTIADPKNEINEICKENNTRIVSLSVKGPQFLKSLRAEPNPFEYRTDISYVISQAVVKLDANVFTLDGKKIMTIENCPKKIGLNSLPIDLVNFAKGTYIIIFEGKTNKNESFRQILKIIKIKEK